jgi:hypothetical protein
VQFSGEAAFLFALDPGQVIAGTAGVPPAHEREARKGNWDVLPKVGLVCRAFAGGTPAVPAIHLSGYRLVPLWEALLDKAL